MRRFALWCSVAVLVGCGKPREQPAAETTAAVSTDTAPEAAAPAPISFAAVAGHWNMRTMAEGSDSAIVTYQLDTGSDGSKWTLHLPKRKPVKARVQASGDSIMADAGPFESVILKGVQVTTNSVFRLQDGKLVGTTVAHYARSGADTVRTLRVEGTRLP